MKKMTIILGLLLCCAGMARAANSIAEWDFRTGAPHAANNAFLFSLQKNSVLGPRGLVVTPAGDTSHGLRAQAAYPALTPDGSFALTITFALDQAAFAADAPAQIYLWDNKYIANPNATQERYHKGFSLFLGRREKQYGFRAFFGYGERTASLFGKYVTLEPDRLYTVTLRFEEYGPAEIRLDDELMVRAELEPGKLAASTVPLQIGDRAGSSHWPIPGRIEQVKLERLDILPPGAVNLATPATALPAPPSLPRDGAVIAAWDFRGSLRSQPGDYELKLRGDTVAVSAAQAAALQITPNDGTRPGGAATLKTYPALTPAGAFSVSVSFFPESRHFQLEKARSFHLLDSKYITAPTDKQPDFHNGFTLLLQGSGNRLTPQAHFGFGSGSSSAIGRPTTVALDAWHVLTMHFTATGKVTFSLDGEPAGEAVVAPGTLAPSKRSLVIGDRVGSTYFPFGGYIGEVVIRTEETKLLNLLPANRHRRAFMRLEGEAQLHTELANYSDSELRDVAVTASVAGIPGTQTRQVASVPPRSSAPLAWTVDTTLLPGDYLLQLKAVPAAGGEPLSADIPFTLVRERTDFMPVVMWGGGSFAKMRDAGFTHAIVNLYPSTGNLSDNAVINGIARLDDALRHGLYTVDMVHGKYRFTTAGRFIRTDRNGNPYPPPQNLEASNPEVKAEFVDIMNQLGQAYGSHPAWNATLLNSEVRDSSRPSFGGGEPAAFKAYAGFDVPADINGKYPSSYRSNPRLPWNQVLPDNHPHLVFFRWFWKEGDGWNPLHTLLTETLHKHIRHPFWTFYDPVVRVPPLWGSGGGADAVSQWTYTYPDPIKIGQATDEVIAMAQGRPGQLPMSMTQAIWYRSQTAPKDVAPEREPEWFAYERDAQFISIAPDFLSEAVWSKISRRIDGIMYHGYGSLIEKTNHGSYCYTNPESQQVLARLSRDVLQPLGPLLKRIPEKAPEVGIFQSFTSSLYAPSHHSFGWSKGWTTDLHLALQWAHFQPVIFYEEHLLRGDIGPQVKVIFLPGTEVITESVLAGLEAFQQRGGILIGDEFTTPAVRLDARLASFKRVLKDPKGGKETLQALGRSIQDLLAPHYRSPFSADSQDLVVRLRGTDSADYAFVINDKRTFGDYVGQWGLVQEKGLPLSGSVTVARAARAAYDLVRHQEVPLQNSAAGSRFAVALEPGAGTLVLLLDRAIAGVTLQAPESARRGQSLACTIAVQDASQQAVPALLPLQVSFTDAAGRELPGSGYYAAENGRLSLEPLLAPNMQPGTARIEVRCLASGRTAAAAIQVQ